MLSTTDITDIFHSIDPRLQVGIKRDVGRSIVITLRKGSFIADTTLSQWSLEALTKADLILYARKVRDSLLAEIDDCEFLNQYNSAPIDFYKDEQYTKRDQWIHHIVEDLNKKYNAHAQVASDYQPGEYYICNSMKEVFRIHWQSLRLGDRETMKGIYKRIEQAIKGSTITCELLDF